MTETSAQAGAEPADAGAPRELAAPNDQPRAPYLEERITRELIGYLRELRDAGARLHVGGDPAFRTICVLRP